MIRRLSRPLTRQRRHPTQASRLAHRAAVDIRPQHPPGEVRHRLRHAGLGRQQAVTADALEAPEQDVQQKAVDEV